MPPDPAQLPDLCGRLPLVYAVVRLAQILIHLRDVLQLSVLRDSALTCSPSLPRVPWRAGEGIRL